MKRGEGGGRPIGARVRNFCEALERLGASTTRDVAPHLGEDRSEVRKTAFRAVRYGLASMETLDALIFRVVPNWRELLDDRDLRRTAAPVRTVPAKPLKSLMTRSMVASVWDLGTNTATA